MNRHINFRRYLCVESLRLLGLLEQSTWGANKATVSQTLKLKSVFFFTTIPCLCSCHFDQFRFSGSPIKHFKCSHHHLFASRDHLSCSNHISGSHFSFLKQKIEPIWFLNKIFSRFLLKLFLFC